MFASFSLAWPWALLGLLILPFLARKGAWWLRYIGLGLLLLALAQPSIQQPSRTAAILVDVSDSLGDSALQQAQKLDLSSLEQDPGETW